MRPTTESAAALAREILEASPVSGILSSPRKREDATPDDRVKIRRISVSGERLYQLERHRGPKAFHQNLDGANLESFLAESLGSRYARAEFTTERGSFTILSNRRGELSAIRREERKSPEKSPETGEHDRIKRHILQEGLPVPFLVDLGVMTADGAVVKSKRDKFRQINRFLEFIEDVLPELKRAAGQQGDCVLDETGTDPSKNGNAGSYARELTIVDFGCGKSYLTFAIYYYLAVMQGIPTRIIGLDLKEDVIESCAALAKKYGYQNLEFAVGNIEGYRGTDHADMVVTLHACDTATDFALAQAVRWEAEVILSVPCCQHELNSRLGDSAVQSAAKEILQPAFHYGIVRERMAALLTDAMRAELLEIAGYRTQILEFIDMSHTPKNLLIRAVRDVRRPHGGNGPSGVKRTAVRAESYRALKDFLGAAPALEAEIAKIAPHPDSAPKEIP